MGDEDQDPRDRPQDDRRDAGLSDPDPGPMTYPGISYALERLAALRRPAVRGDPERESRA